MRISSQLHCSRITRVVLLVLILEEATTALLVRIPASCIMLFGLVAGQPGLAADRILDLPFGEVSKLASPDGQYILYGEPYRDRVNTGPQLWIENTRTSERKLLLQLDGTARAAWSPDGTAFYVNDRLASDSTLSYLYETSTLKRIEIRDMIVGADPEAARVAKGHAYFDVDRWQSSQDALVHLHGHTDEAPVLCFNFRYQVSRARRVKRLSRRISRVTARGCRE